MHTLTGIQYGTNDRGLSVTMVLLSIVRILNVPHSSREHVGYEFTFMVGDKLLRGEQPCGNWSTMYPGNRELSKDGYLRSHPDFCIGIGWWDLDRMYHDASVDVERAETEYCGPPCTCYGGHVSSSCIRREDQQRLHANMLAALE